MFNFFFLHSVPFRDSVLTKLLKNALGGNSKTIMVSRSGLILEMFFNEISLQMYIYKSILKSI